MPLTIEQNSLVAREVLGWSVEQANDAPYFAEDMTAAWPLVERMRSAPLPVQKRFILILCRSVARHVGSPPDSIVLPARLILEMTPEDVCAAAVAAMRVGERKR